MQSSSSPSSFASNLHELIRLARVALDAEEFAEFLQQIAADRLEEAA